MQIKTLEERDITKQDIIDFINKMADKLQGDTMPKENETDDEKNAPVLNNIKIGNIYFMSFDDDIKKHLNGKEYAIYIKTKKKRTKEKYCARAFKRMLENSKE